MAPGGVSVRFSLKVAALCVLASLVFPGTVRSAGTGFGMAGAASRMAPRLDKKIRSVVHISSAIFPKSGAADLIIVGWDFIGFPNYSAYKAELGIQVANKISAKITSINLVYTDATGKPVTFYGAAGTTNIVSMRLAPETDNKVTVSVLDNRVIEEMMNPAFYPKLIYCHITIRGEDDNGYEIKLTANLTITGCHF